MIKPVVFRSAVKYHFEKDKYILSYCNEPTIKTLTLKSKKMTPKILLFSCGMFFLLSACNNGTGTKAPEQDTTKAVPKDTVAAAPVTPAVEAPPPIDSAAVTKEYLAAQKKSKKTKPAAAKKQGKEEVIMYSEEVIPSHEALEQPVATKATPAPTRVIHTKEYVYFMPSENASYPGGQGALQTYIKAHVEYPEDALKYHVRTAALSTAPRHAGEHEPDDGHRVWL